MNEQILTDTAKFLLQVFSQDYGEEFERMLVAGGGGNSMFVNAWNKLSQAFVRCRISSQARQRLQDKGYNNVRNKQDIPHSFLHNNAKTVEARRRAGKELHMDHNPSNVKVLNLVKDKVRSYRNDDLSDEQKLEDFKEFIMNIQTLDIITIEQDKIRTLKDENMTKREKEMLSAQERDNLLNDTFEDIEGTYSF